LADAGQSRLTRLLREVCGEAVLDDPTLMASLADHTATAR